MMLVCWKIFRTLFSTVCVTGLLLMVSYWYYKFEVEDRDIGVVDYLSFDEAKGLDLPSFVFCFQDPFAETRIQEVIPNVSTNSYVRYLNGEVFDGKFERVRYENVTINLKDYFTHAFIELTDGTLIRKQKNDLKHEIIFNGFYQKNYFLRCQSVLVDKENIRKIKNMYFYYNKQKMFEDIQVPPQHSLKVYTGVYYPNQFLVEVHPLKYMYLSRMHGGLNVVIEGIEILKRRYSHNRQCKKDGRFYDNLVMQRHIESIGCRPPYLSPNNSYPMCRNIKDMKKSKYAFNDVRSKYYSKPCQRISKLDHEAKLWTHGAGIFSIAIMYPEEVKIITQSKEVDGHTLIGNIGGYIGLFLGTFLK